jgi:oxygen-dependent protoporphyrinogen oxidase
VVVVGGGLSGLSAAHRVWEHFHASGREVNLTVLDAGARPGGVVETGRRDGFFGKAGRTVLSRKNPPPSPWPAGWDLKPGDRHQQKFQQSFVGKGKTLLPTPEGFYLLAPSKLGPLFRTKILSWPGKIRAAMELVISPRPGDKDESLASFVRRRFGREVLDRWPNPWWRASIRQTRNG